MIKGLEKSRPFSLSAKNMGWLDRCTRPAASSRVDFTNASIYGQSILPIQASLQPLPDLNQKL